MSTFFSHYSLAKKIQFMEKVMPTLSMKTEINRDVLRRLADSRLAEFETLRTATPPHYAAALYLAGYAVEALLKCAICKALNHDELPVIFHIHDLDVLLFFSGLYKEIQTDAAVWTSFRRIQATWNEKLRYTDPLYWFRLDASGFGKWVSGHWSTGDMGHWGTSALETWRSNAPMLQGFNTHPLIILLLTSSEIGKHQSKSV